jgi:hypothetical protein
MGRDFFPRREADIVTWSINFDQLINIAPESYGLTAAQAADYSAAHDAFVAAYRRANSPDTGTIAATAAKQTALKTLENQARILARIVRAMPQVDAAMRVELGLSPRNGGGKSPAIGAPASVPYIAVLGVIGHTIRVRLSDSESAGRGKPPGVAWAVVHYFVGESAPANYSAWQVGCHTSETTAEVNIDLDHPPGAQVWLSASWLSPRAESGHGSPPIHTYIGYGPVRMAG